MLKTPISILQEMMVKKGKVPKYQLIHDGGGSHENTFTWSVSCEGLRTTGTGRCKKTAKHIAAKKMLERIADQSGLLALPPTPADSPIRTEKPKPTPYISNPDEPFLNAIGALQDICSLNELKDPTYDVTSDIGPPHARVFTVQCIVSGFKEEGISTTKKNAKHVAARKMFNRIREVLADIEGGERELFEQADKLDETDIIEMNEKVKKLFTELTPNPVIKKTSLGVALSEFHNKLIMAHDDDSRRKIIGDLDELRKVVDDNSTVKDANEFMAKCAQKFKVILESMNADFEVYSMPADNNNTLIAINITTIPTIVELETGNDINDLLVLTFNRAIDTLQILLNE